MLYTRAIFALFADIAEAFPSPMREELHAIAFHCFSRASHDRLFTSNLRLKYANTVSTVLLKDEKLDVDLVGPSLPILKALCDRSLRTTEEAAAATVGKVLNGMMSACLMNIDEMR